MSQEKEKGFFKNEKSKLRLLGTSILLIGILYAILPDLIPGPVDDACVLFATTAIKMGCNLLDKARGFQNIRVQETSSSLTKREKNL